MKTELDGIQKPYLQPRLGVRVAWWFGIYFGAQIPLLFMLPDFWSIWERGTLPIYGYGFCIFPVGLSCNLELIVSREEILLVFPYAFYFVHLLSSICFRSKKVFWAMMLVLIFAVVLNFIGCQADLKQF